MGRMEKTGITPHHNDCFYEARCCLGAVCGLGLGPSSPIIHGTRWVVPSLEHCQWSHHSSIPTPTALYTSSRVVTIASIPPCVRCSATCVPLNIISHPHILFCLISTFQRIVMTLQFALYLGTVSVCIIGGIR